MNKKGFTLIEVLIVVVIIAVLAALILPRFVGQTERAVIAEGQQILGAMRRGQLNWMDFTGNAAPTDVTSCGFAACNAAANATWARIGVNPPNEGTGRYNYACTTASGNCVATRVNDPSGQYAGNTITLGVVNGTFMCGGAGTTPYSDLGNGRGCTTG